jgi:hypothetical protein
MNTTSNTSCEASESLILGWNSMPTYGEILPSLVGESHTLPRHFLSLGKPASTAPTQTFWSMLANSK